MDRAWPATAIRKALRWLRPETIRENTIARSAAAIDALLDRGRLEAAERRARRFRAAYPAVAYGKTVCDFFDRMPPADGLLLPFEDDRAKEVQIVARANADTVMLLFCGHAERLGLALPAIHRWFGRMPASLVYLRDFRRLHYLAGIPSLGADRAASLAGLRALVASLGGRRIVCYGTSGGVFAALDYGLELGAEAVLALAGPVNLTREFNASLHMGRAIARLHDTVPGVAIDLRRAYETAARAPRTWLVYGENNWDDRLHAETMAGLPGVTLVPVKNFQGHNVAMEFITRGSFASLLEALMPP
jgi:hypothetical protein